MSKPAILFDLDGTLVDSLGDIAASANFVREQHGLESLAEHEVRRMVGDGAAKLLERALADLPGPVDHAAAMAVYVEHHLDQCTRLVQTYPGVTEHLRRWQAAGHPMAVVTNKPERFARQILDHLELDELLPVLIGGDSSPARKPSPIPIQAALERLGAGAEGAMMVGDGLQDIRAGKAAGLKTAAVLFGFRDESTLRAEGADEYWREFGMPERLHPR
ncbi:MAG: HAD family hydrolase [Planctomycetota bacterium]|jgi:phosphoglycolate phosphatase